MCCKCGAACLPSVDGRTELRAARQPPRRNLGDLSDLEGFDPGGGGDPAAGGAACGAGRCRVTGVRGGLAGAQWVVLVGPRRRVAAGRVYDEDPEATLGVLVREDAIADDALGQLDAMTAENVARAPLSPVEEAAGRRQRPRGDGRLLAVACVQASEASPASRRVAGRTGGRPHHGRRRPGDWRWPG